MLLIKLIWMKLIKILKDYVSSHNKKVDFYIINYECLVKSDNNSTRIIKTVFNYDSNNNDQNMNIYYSKLTFYQ